MDSEKRVLRQKTPRQFSMPYSSDEQTKYFMKRMRVSAKKEKPFVAAEDCLNHRLSRGGVPEMLVAWADGTKPDWVPILDISSDLVGAYLSVLAEKCPLFPQGNLSSLSLD